MNFECKTMLLFLLMLVVVSCHDEEALKQEKIENIIAERIAKHKRDRWATCQSNALKDAVEKADSTMIQLALSQVDTSNQITRPTKPIRPEINIPVDTTPIKPLFQDSVIPTIDTFNLQDSFEGSKNDF